MKKLNLLAVLIIIGTISCSKPGSNSLEENGPAVKSDETTISRTLGLDSLVAGKWTYLGSATDYPPFFFPANEDNYGFIAFDSASGYIEIRNGSVVDSGRYRVIDSTYITSHQRRLLDRESKMKATTYPRFYYLFITNDTLSLSHGLGGQEYRRSSGK